MSPFAHIPECPIETRQPRCQSWRDRPCAEASGTIAQAETYFPVLGSKALFSFSRGLFAALWNVLIPCHTRSLAQSTKESVSLSRPKFLCVTRSGAWPSGIGEGSTITRGPLEKGKFCHQMVFGAVRSEIADSCFL